MINKTPQFNAAATCAAGAYAAIEGGESCAAAFDAIRAGVDEAAVGC